MITVSTHLKQQVLIGSCVVFIALIGLTSVYAAWQWYNDLKIISQKVTPPIIPSNDEIINLIASIPANNLFGKPLDKSDLPFSSFKFKVTGIVKSESKNIPSKAYISVENQPGKVYRVGDTLPYGVKIHDITADTVILENEGRFEKVTLARQKLEFKPRDKQGKVND